MKNKKNSNYNILFFKGLVHHTFFVSQWWNVCARQRLNTVIQCNDIYMAVKQHTYAIRTFSGFLFSYKKKIYLNEKLSSNIQWLTYLRLPSAFSFPLSFSSDCNTCLPVSPNRFPPTSKRVNFSLFLTALASSSPPLAPISLKPKCNFC